MKVILLILLAVSAQSIDFSPFKAHCQLDILATQTCETVLTAITADVFKGKVSRPYNIVSLKIADYLYALRTQPVLHFTVEDEVELILKDTNEGCLIQGQSQSGIFSYYDFNQNYCNIAVLLRNARVSSAVASHCKWRFGSFKEALRKCQL